MNNRKQHVIKAAHRLFIEKGFQATSIQDILDYSGISKGTFYNYFSSKTELIIALFKLLLLELVEERNNLLVDQDPSDIEVFKQQMVLQLKKNRANKVVPLFEEVIVSNDLELKEFIREVQVKMIRWTFERFVDIFGKEKEPFLLDAAIMFTGILHQNMKYQKMTHGVNVNFERVVHYSVDRIATVVQDVYTRDEPLLLPEDFPLWNEDKSRDENQIIARTIALLKKDCERDSQFEKINELLDFLLEELTQTKKIREHLLDSTVTALSSLGQNKHWQQLQTIIEKRKGALS